MRDFRTRLLVASVVSAASFACSDGPESALGPTETDLEPVTVSEPAFSVTAGDVESCLDTWEIDGTEPGYRVALRCRSRNERLSGRLLHVESREQSKRLR